MMNWISVKDRLPEKDKEVLVFTIEGNVRSLFVIDGEFFRAQQGCASCREWYGIEDITHWISLQKGPKDE